MTTAKPENKFFNMMKKWGWDEGKGLGKQEDGGVDYVRVKKKDDNTGIGMVKAKEVTGNWWERLYDHRAQETIAEAQFIEDGVESDSESEAAAEASRLAEEAARTAAYAGRFVGRSAQLHDADAPADTNNGKRKRRQAAVPASVAAVLDHLEDVGHTPSAAPLDLHKVCGGASFGKFTGHHRPEGKLKRLARQDSLHRSSSFTSLSALAAADTVPPGSPDTQATPSAAGARAEQEEEEEGQQQQQQQQQADDDDEQASRRHKKKRKKSLAATTATAATSTDSTDSTTTTHNEQHYAQSDQAPDQPAKHKKPSKSTTSHKPTQEQDQEPSHVLPLTGSTAGGDDADVPDKKKKKKNKKNKPTQLD